jgi:replicative DNA helicase
MNTHDIEIERAVIGEILTFETLKEKALLLDVSDFHYSEHKEICKAIIRQTKENHNFDFITVANECGFEYRDEIQNCIQLAISMELFEEHFRLLKEMASRRRIISRFQKMTVEGEVSISSVQRMLDDENEKMLFSEDLLFDIIKNLINKYPTRTNKFLLNAKIRNKIK